MEISKFLDRQQLMLTDHGYQPDEAPRLASALTRLGGELAAALGQAEDDGFFDQLAALLEAQDCKPQLTRHDGIPHLHYARDGAPLNRWPATMPGSGRVLSA